MPDKDFEQQMRRDLQEWEMQPPPAIRQAVLDAVRERRRRRLLLWVPISLLSLGGLAWGGWHILEGPGPGAPAPGAAVRREAVPGGKGAAPAAVLSGATLAARGSGAAPSAASRVAPTTGRAKATPAASGVEAAPTIGRAKATPVMSRAVGQVAPAQNGVPVAPAQSGLPGAPALNGFPGAAAAQPAGNPMDGILTSVGPTTLLNGPWATSVEAATLQPPNLQRTKASNKPNEKPVAKTGSNDKWLLHIYGQGGLSGQGSFLRFHTPGQVVYTHFYPATSQSQYAGGTLGGGPPTSGYDTLTTRTSGLGWSLGVNASRKLSRHFRLGFGLAYDQLMTKLGPVGADGSSGNYFRDVGTTASGTNATGGGGRFDYVNRYQLLRLSMDVTWMVAPASRWNPSLYIGGEPAYLFPGNALMYRPDYSGYQKDGALYRHVQLYGEMGCMVDLLHEHRFTLEAGPFVQYGFSGVEKPAPVKDHLNYAGLRLGIVLPTKKRTP